MYNPPAKSTSEHPTIKLHKLKVARGEIPTPPAVLDSSWLRQTCLDAGADDAGFVRVDSPELKDHLKDIVELLPPTRTLISIVCRMNRDPVRSPARSIANLEFHHVGDKVNDVARSIVSALESMGYRAVNPSMGFPMEVRHFPDIKPWTVSHKPVAVAAGMGHMGIHRNLIHPKFGNFILLGTILTDAEVTTSDKPLDYNPCLSCKLCVSACPVGAIEPDGRFNFSACVTHNYREFLGGFTDWVENIADSKDAAEYRRRVSDSESASMWQSLSFGANYKAAYCMAVCPAGEDVLAPFLNDRSRYLEDVVKPLQNKVETVYVVADSDAEEYVKRRYPHKRIKVVHNGLRPSSVQGFLRGLRQTFQRSHSDGLSATYHFTFTGKESAEATVTIQNRKLTIENGRLGNADLHVTADSASWIGFIRKERNLVWELLTGKIKLRGSPLLLLAFGKCFPS